MKGVGSEMSATFLISTPSEFVQEFVSDALSVRQIAENMGDYRHLAHRGPFERHFYVLRVNTRETERRFVSRIALDHTKVIAILSLWYGKHIYDHGLIQSQDTWMLPDMLSMSPNAYFRHSVYSGEHKKPPITECDWCFIQELKSVLESLVTDEHGGASIMAAASCYAEALRLLPIDREIAFFRLVQAMECVCTTSQFSDEERFSHDEELWGHLRWLEQLNDCRGPSCAKFLKRRLQQAARGVWLWLSDCIDEEFFVEGRYALDAATLKKRVANAYKLRSMYAHANVAFGDFVDPTIGRCEDFETVPDFLARLCLDAALRKTLSCSPSFLGLERIVRYGLRNEMHKQFAT